MILHRCRGPVHTLTFNVRVTAAAQLPRECDRCLLRNGDKIPVGAWPRRCTVSNAAIGLQVQDFVRASSDATQQRRCRMGNRALLFSQS
jgi:hypothetical protein